MAKKPNILLFLTDDHAPWTLPCYGNTEVRAPTFDRMARDGVLFRNAFSPSPVCSPGRACLLTGLTNSQHGVHDWIAIHDPETQERDWLAGQVTLAEMLQHEGYACGLAGKWHIGQCYRKPRGYDWYFGFAMQGPHEGITPYVYEGRNRMQRGNSTTIVTEQAIGFLDRVPTDQPFFLQIGYTDTHSPYLGQEPELVASYKNATCRDIRVDPQHPWRWNENFPEDVDITPEEARLRHINQYAAVTDIDRHIGAVYDALRASGQDENTVIIYTSDHGLSLGQHGFWGKGNGTRPLNMYDISIRVPLLVTGPMVPGGLEIDHCVDHFDTFETICALCGTHDDHRRAKTPYPGNSYLPILEGGTVPHWDNTRYGEYGDMRMVRTSRYKLVRRYPNGPDDLFDLAEDPNEEQNQIDNPEYAATIDALNVQIEAFFAQYEDPERSGLNVKSLPRHNTTQKPNQLLSAEAWRDGIRESRGYP